MTIEDEITHWWKDEKGAYQHHAIRLESEKPQRYNGFPRDGRVVVRLLGPSGSTAMKLSPDEALRLSTQLVAIAKDMLNQKRVLWAEQEVF